MFVLIKFSFSYLHKKLWTCNEWKILLTATRPALIMANDDIYHSMILGAHIPTWSPLSKSSASNPRANDSIWNQSVVVRNNFGRAYYAFIGGKNQLIPRLMVQLSMSRHFWVVEMCATFTVRLVFLVFLLLLFFSTEPHRFDFKFKLEFQCIVHSYILFQTILGTSVLTLLKCILRHGLGIFRSPPWQCRKFSRISAAHRHHFSSNSVFRTLGCHWRLSPS